MSVSQEDLGKFPKAQALIQALLDAGQGHIFNAWNSGKQDAIELSAGPRGSRPALGKGI